MRVGVVIFPGSNCDHDIEHVFGSVCGATMKRLWHKEKDVSGLDVIVIPGGFSYGDYLRTGAMAKLSPIMESVAQFAGRGGPVIGICNGFQILCEAGLLPGALLHNVGMRFLSQFVHLKIESTRSVFTRGVSVGTVVTCPIAHGEGNYFADDVTLKNLEDGDQIVFRYCDAHGGVDSNSRISNPNGSCASIAGVCNSQGNVLGLMPHPERASESLIGWIGTDSGRQLLEGVLR